MGKFCFEFVNVLLDFVTKNSTFKQTECAMNLHSLLYCERLKIYDIKQTIWT